MKHYIAIGEASKRLGVCIKTIKRWDKDGKIQCYRTPGGHRRFALVEIERIISGDLTEEVRIFSMSESLNNSKTGGHHTAVLHVGSVQMFLQRLSSPV